MGNLCQSDVPMLSLPGPVGHEEVYMRPVTNEMVSLLFTDAGHKNETGNDELCHHPLGAVGIAMNLLFAGYITSATLLLEMLFNVLTAFHGVLLVLQDGDKPEAVAFRVEGPVIVFGGRYGRATRFVQPIRHNRLLLWLVVIIHLSHHTSIGISESSQWGTVVGNDLRIQKEREPHSARLLLRS